MYTEMRILIGMVLHAMTLYQMTRLVARALQAKVTLPRVVYSAYPNPGSPTTVVVKVGGGTADCMHCIFYNSMEFEVFHKLWHLHSSMIQCRTMLL